MIDDYERNNIIRDTLWDWAWATAEKLAKRVIYQLSRREAMGVFGGYSFTTVWGEYSHEIQTGAYDGVSEYFEGMVEDLCIDAANSLAPYEKEMFKKYADACGEMEKDDDGFIFLVSEIRGAVSAAASSRNLARYADDYHWWDHV